MSVKPTGNKKEPKFDVVSYSITIHQLVKYRMDISACSLDSLKSQMKDRLETLSFDDVDTDGYEIAGVKINRVESVPTLISNHLKKQHGNSKERKQEQPLQLREWGMR